MTIMPQQYICDLNPYQPGLPIDLVAREYGVDPEQVIKLASNENPLGVSPKASKALERALPEAHRYPEQHNLLQALSDHYKVTPEMIMLGNGSNDVLDLIARTFLNDGDEAISSQYAFAVYHIAAQSAGAKNVIAPAKEFGHDLAAILNSVTEKTKLIWLANPNNPTGTFIPYSNIKKFISQVPNHVVVVLDEAYYEYLSGQDRDDSISWIQSHPNLIVVRTFSKVYGLAGLRIGYGIMAADVAEIINRVRQPFNANILALTAACAALDDKSFVQKSFEFNTHGKKQLTDSLSNLDLEHLPAYGNFVAFKVGSAASVCEKLLRQGIIVRPLGGYGMPDWIRVSVGLDSENRRFLDALANIV